MLMSDCWVNTFSSHINLRERERENICLIKIEHHFHLYLHQTERLLWGEISIYLNRRRFISSTFNLILHVKRIQMRTVKRSNENKLNKISSELSIEEIYFNCRATAVLVDLFAKHSVTKVEANCAFLQCVLLLHSLFQVSSSSSSTSSSFYKNTHTNANSNHDDIGRQ